MVIVAHPCHNGQFVPEMSRVLEKRAIHPLPAVKIDPWCLDSNRKFVVFGRMLNINLDYYRTDFTHQVVVDNESDPEKVNFYNLDGDSYSNCYQVEVKYELINLPLT